MKQSPSVEKIKSCARADKSARVDVRYVPVRDDSGRVENMSAELTVQCALCETDLSARNDWEPFLQGISDIACDYALYETTSREVEHTRVCFPCMDAIYFVEFETN